MNKIRILLTVIVIMFCCLLSGCDYDKGESLVSSVQVEYSDFDLVIDSKTKIVYIDNEVCNANTNAYHVYTPYYSKNGNLCRYEDGKLMEVNADDD